MIIAKNVEKNIDNSNYGKNKFRFFPFMASDSVIVIYDNTYRIAHYRPNRLKGASKSILDIHNWKEIEYKERESYKYIYVFDNESYNEAKNKN